VRGYVIPAYRYALGEVGGAIENDFEQWMIDYIIQISGETQTVDLRGLKRSARRPLEGKADWQKEQAIMDAMMVLEQAGWAIPIENDLHKHKVTWVINPSLPEMFKNYRANVIKAKQRHVDYAYRFAYSQGKDRKLVTGYIPEDDKGDAE
jgi:hypothetical protein